MLIRTVGEHAVVISQPAHAAISGQLARAWGNLRFGAVEPFDDVCLGALLHDIGWIDWEQAPTLNSETGLPDSFLQLSTRVHLDIWKEASRRASTFGRYPGLLTSMHFTGLYERFHDYSRDSEDDARDARALVAHELAFQEDTIARLRADPSMATFATDDILRRNRGLVAVWDGISLALCHGVTEPRTFRGVPATSEEVEITLAPTDGSVSVDPWPFGVERLTVRADGRILRDRYGDQESMRQALADAEWTSVETVLQPAG
jgi:hypothetical protein